MSATTQPGQAPSWRLAVQEHLVEGRDLVEKFDRALAAGFDGLELLGRGGGGFEARAHELASARRSGVVMSSVCVAMDHFIGDFDPARRRSARDGMKELLTGIAAAGGTGAITPAAFGQFSRCLPPFTPPPRTAAQDREILLDELGTLGEHAAQVGAVVLLEPLNRYEDHLVNTLGQATGLVSELGMDSVRVMADTFHMSIEEDDPAARLREVGSWLGHVQLADSNRLEPGAGHIDWNAHTQALVDIGYDGWLALECGLSGPAASVLPAVPLALGSRRAFGAADPSR